MAKGRDKGGREPKKPKANKKTVVETSPFKQPAAAPAKAGAKKA